MSEKRRRTERRSTKPSLDYNHALLKEEEDAIKKAIRASLKKKTTPKGKSFSLRGRYTENLSSPSSKSSNESTPEKLVKRKKNNKDLENSGDQNTKKVKKKKLQTKDPDFVCDLKDSDIEKANFKVRHKEKKIDRKEEGLGKSSISPEKKRKKMKIKKMSSPEEFEKEDVKPKIKKRRKRKLQLTELDESKDQIQKDDLASEGSPPKRRRKRRKKLENCENQESDASAKEENESVPFESNRLNVGKERFGKVLQAQRKFAHSQPCSPSSLLLKQIATPLPERPKTEDFITFLCLRGTPSLPEELEFFNNPCLPPSPLSSDDEEGLPVSPFFKRQTETLSQNIQPSLNFSQELIFEKPTDDFCHTPSTPQPKVVLKKLSAADSTKETALSSSSGTSSPIISSSNTTSGSKPKGRKKDKLPENVDISPTDTPSPPKRPTQLNLTGSAFTKVIPGSSEKPKSPTVQFVAAGESPIVSSKELGPKRRKKKRRSLDFDDSPTKKAKNSASGEKHNRKTTKKALSVEEEQVDKGLPDLSPGVDAPSGLSKSSLDLSDASSQDSQPLTDTKESPGKSPQGVNMKGKKAQTKLKVVEQNLFEENTLSAPVFKPMEMEFKDPAKYIKRITPFVMKFGMCVVVPPAGWRPSSNISDDVRFNTKVQHIHRFKNRYPPNTRQLNAIKKHLQKESVPLDAIPQIGCCEVDIPNISSSVKDVGGVQKVNSIKKWQKLADALNLPKHAQGRVNRLQDIYYKYILPYDLLSKENKDKYSKEVEKDAEGDFCQEEIEYKGKSASLVGFHRIALNAQEMYSKGCNSVNAIEAEFWDIVEKGNRHVAAISGEVDTSKCGPSFQVGKSKSGWNLSALPLVNGSALKPLGQLPGVNTPWLRFDSIYSTSGWRKNLNAFYMVEYLHAESSKIWYAVPSCMEKLFVEQMKNKVPNLVNDEEDRLRKSLVSPLLLTEKKFSVVRAVQSEGQFVVVLPNVYHCIVNTGYCCSEAVHFATTSWLLPDPLTGLTQDTSSLKFPIEKVIVQTAKEETGKAKSSEYLPGLLKRLRDLRDEEIKIQETLLDAGLKKVNAEIGSSTPQSAKLKRKIIDWEICEKCDKLCYLSMVKDDENNYVYCLEHTLELIQSGKPAARLSLVTRMTKDDLDELVQKLEKCVNVLENKDNTEDETDTVQRTQDKVTRKRKPRLARESKDKDKESDPVVTKKRRGRPRLSDKERKKKGPTSAEDNPPDDTKSKESPVPSRTGSPEFDYRNVFSTIEKSIRSKPS